jgi:hypothetical protein
MIRVFSALALVVGATLCYGQSQMCTTEEYIARLSEIECTQVERELVFAAYNDCGRDDLGNELVDLCRTHGSVKCNEQLLLIALRNPLEIRSCYRDDDFREQALPCTSDCKQDLEMFLNVTLGCCSRAIFDDQLAQLYPSVVIINSLIGMCNISRSLLPDRCATPSTLSYTPSGATVPSCTQNELDQKLSAVPCSSEYIQPRLDLATDCRFSDLYNEEPTLACEEDDNGVICAERAFDPTAVSMFEQSALNCIEGAETCSDTCRASIVSLRDVLGCCLNNLYNNTFFSLYATSYELWSMCDLETIEFCGDASGLQVTTLLLAVTFLVLALIL